jgi:asparagine synthase (glutamine-hydrolysing)
MCGIAVSLSTSGEFTEPWALSRLRHRGPDSEGTFTNLRRGLVMEHTRLSIIDPENQDADQPFSDRSGRWTIVYNGELFNFRELRNELERQGTVFRTNSDTEVVLASLIRDGDRALERFRGMFAFIVWDNETGELLGARDQLGVKPLYYAQTDGTFVAASELRAVLAHPSIKKELEPAAVVEFLAFGYVGGDRTLVKGVKKLMPGHVLRLTDGKIRIEEFWDVLPAPVSSAPEQELATQLEAAVAAALVSDVPVSLMLSGGLDSATIASVAARHANPAELTAYSVSFGLPDDESGAAARLARDLGLRHREIFLTQQSVGELFEDWLDRLDVPTANPTWIAVSAIARAVHEDGMKVLLSGDGGDELFGGYNRWMTYLRFHDRVWAKTPRSVRKLGGHVTRPLLRGLAGDIARRAARGGDLFVGSRPFHDDDLNGCLGPVARAAARDHEPEVPVEQLRARFDARMPGADYLTWMSYLALKSDLVEDYLVRLDTMGMQHSVEGRVPLLDPILARWSFGISQRQKVDGYEQKALFRRVVRPSLPEYIVNRPKQGFCPPVATWATSLLASRSHGSGVLVDEGLLAPDAFKRLQRERSVGASFALWALGTLDHWCEQNL